jgi:hypothetical protein
MVRATATMKVGEAQNTVIARCMDDVFGRLADISDYSRWMPKLGVGTTYYDKG